MTGASRPAVLGPDQSGITRAADILRHGGLVALPTETVYGLAARADCEEAVQSIYRAKGRPSFNPLIAHVPDLEAAQRIAHFDDHSVQLARAFWPGALTLVLPRRSDARIAPSVTAGLTTAAIRCPAHETMQAVLKACDFPLAAPSANRSGALSPTAPAHVLDSLGTMIDGIIDAGSCSLGLESTIVAVRRGGGWEVLRPGPISEPDIAAIIGPAGQSDGGKLVEAPGQLASHYSPAKPLRLDAAHARPEEFHIGFGNIAGHENLSATGDVTEAAARLYAIMHVAAESELPAIAVAPIPASGIGAAIQDRLRRAAA